MDNRRTEYGHQPLHDISQRGYQPVNPNAGHQPNTASTTQPPNTGSGVQKPNND